MDDHMKQPNAAQKGAQKYFTKAAHDDALAKESRKKERSVSAAKTARLRALRLAKEAADKEEADKLAAQKADVAPTVRRKRPSAVKPVKILRMSY